MPTRSPEAEWVRMEAEWREITDRQRIVHGGEVARWEADLTTMKAAQDVIVRAGRWVGGPDDFLSIIGKARREAYHSAVLAWLLDPLGRHGLGSSVLQSVLRACGRDVDSAELSAVRCDLEVQQDETRADIVVSGLGFTLLIENKVDAGEQRDQCDRLFHRFGQDSGSVLLFLTPRGRRPVTATAAAKDAFKTMSYPQLAAMICNAFEGVVRTDATSHGREVVSNYLATLKREFR